MALHAQVLFLVRHVDGVAELPARLRHADRLIHVGPRRQPTARAPSVRMVSDVADDRVVRGRRRLDVVGCDAPRAEPGLSRVTTLTFRTSLWLGDHPSVSRLLPFLDEWVVDTVVTLAAADGQIEPD